jgi:hypothetical protein
MHHQIINLSDITIAILIFSQLLPLFRQLFFAFLRGNNDNFTLLSSISPLRASKGDNVGRVITIEGAIEKRSH